MTTRCASDFIASVIGRSETKVVSGNAFSGTSPEGLQCQSLSKHHTSDALVACDMLTSISKDNDDTWQYGG